MSDTTPVVAPVKDKRVAFVGTAPSWLKTPFSEPDIDIWFVGSAIRYCADVDNIEQAPEGKRNKKLPRVSRFFEIHHRKIWIQWAEQLASYNVPVTMQQHYDDVPQSIPYPLEEAQLRFPGVATSIKYGDQPWYACTINYMFALAIIEGYTRIELYGTHAAADTEYAFEDPSISYWIGLCHGIGIDVFITPESSLLAQHHIYGFEDRPERIIRAERRVQEIDADIVNLKKELTGIDEQRQGTVIKHAYMKGARAEAYVNLRDLAQRA